jgi:hypothetical protein
MLNVISKSAGGLAQAIEHLPRKLKPQVQTPILQKKKKKSSISSHNLTLHDFRLHCFLFCFVCGTKV